MKERYKFNPKLKRLEPTETLCQFCGENHSKGMQDNYFTPIFQENGRTELIVYRSVSFKKILIGIPRCRNCKSIHFRSKGIAWLLGIPSGILLFLLGYYLLKSPWNLFSFIPAGFAFFLLPDLVFKNMLVKNKNILTEKDGAEKDPFIQDLVIQGWTLKQPST